MASAVVPTMSDRGWVSSPGEKADFLLSYFFESDANQTYLYKGQVINIQWLLAEYGNDIPQITNELRQALEKYLSLHFDSATVQVENNDNVLVNTSNAITMYIRATVTQAGKSYNVSSLIQNVNSRFQRVIGYTNTGVLSAN